MAIWIVKNSGKISYGIKRYLCDTLEDLPYSENGEVVIPGSKAYVISEKKTYMMGSDEEWHEINEGSGGGASSMSQLTDVDLTNLEDGQVLKYDEDTQTWKPGDDASATSLGNLDDVDLTGLQNGQVIIYDSTTEKWLASDIPSDIAEVTQAQYDALPSETKNLPIIYQISDKGYFFYKGKKFHEIKEMTMAEYDQLSPAEQNNGVEYFITDAPEIVTEITLADYEELTVEEQMNGTIYQIIDCGYFFYKGNRFMASLELTLAEYNELTLEEQMNGTEYFITDAPDIITDLTQAQYDVLTTEQKNNGSIYQISNKGYFYYKGKQFRASCELTQAEFDALPTSKKNDGTEYLITDATTSIGDIDDVSISGATDGQSLYYDATLGVWKNSAGKIVYAEIDDVLDAGETTITFTSDYITTDSVVEPHVDSDFDGVTYDSLVIANGSVTLTFPEQAEDMPVMVRVWIDGYGAANNIEIDDDHALPDAVWSGEKIQEEITNIYEQITNLYDNTATYNVGDTVIYNNNYYENITQITVPEDFDPNKWNEINFEERLAEKVDNTEFADKYSETSTYQEGDIVIYNNKFYINTTPISAPGEAWDPTHWQAISLSDLIPDVSTKMDKSNPTGTGSLSLNRKADTTIGDKSTAIGNDTTASGNYSYAEGSNTVASGRISHAEGAGSIASGYVSHAEGYSTTASGTRAHAEGYYTIAQRRSQHVIGEYNVEDTTGADTTTKGSYIEIVGNGTADSARSNARTLDWQGNEVLAGDLTINGNTSVGTTLSNLASAIPDDISDLGDVDTTGATDGQLLGYNGTTHKWVPVTGGSGGATTLAALTDTSISNPTTGQGLVYNATSGKWENGTIGSASGGSANTITYDNTISGLNATDVQDAIDELKSIINSLINMLGNTYDSTSSYSVGDRVIYNNNYYICNTDIPAPGETWNSSHWTLTNITGQMPDGAFRGVVL